jgi:RimJ/RimL family protein N-acetyltransferase
VNPAQHGKAEIGFVLSRSYWNRGLISEALTRVLEYSFQSIGLNRIEGFCLLDNRAGIGVLERVGMKREGVLREYLSAAQLSQTVSAQTEWRFSTPMKGGQNEKLGLCFHNARSSVSFL